MQVVHWPVTQRVAHEWVSHLTNLRLATFTNGETPPMSRVTSEINLVPNPHLCTQRKQPDSNYCPGFSKHWTCLETNCCLPVSKAWNNALSPTDTSPESPLHAQNWRNGLHPPWELLMRWWWDPILHILLEAPSHTALPPARFWYTRSHWAGHK